MLKFDFKNKFKIDNKDGSKQVEEKHNQNDELNKTQINSLKTEMIASLLKGTANDEEDKTVTFADMTAIEEELEPWTKEKLEAEIEEKLESPIEQKVESKENVDLEAKLEEKLVAKVEEKLKATIEEKLGSQVFVSRQTNELPQGFGIKKSAKRISPESEKISRLIKAIETSTEKIIVPFIDMGEGKISYPILAKIEEDVDNLDFLEKLASQNFDILERTVYERLVVCPEHP